MRRLIIAAAAALAFAGGLAAGLMPPRAVAPFALDATGPARLDAALAGDWSLVFFGFTRCPDVCPNTLQLLSDARGRIADAGENPPRIVLITVDPEHDDVQRLSSYVAYFGEGVVGATGSPDDIARVAADLGIVYRRVPLPDGSYTMDHTASVLLLDPQMRLRAVFSPPLRAAALADDVIATMEIDS